MRMLMQVGLWVEGTPVEPKLEVQVGPCSKFTRVSYDGYGIASCHLVTHLLEQALIVLIDRYQPRGVL